MTYDNTKEYQTRDGREVMLLPQLDWTGDLHGMFKDEAEDWCGASWSGDTLRHRGNDPDLDLVEKTKTYTVWVHLIERIDGSRYYSADDERLTECEIAHTSTIISIARLEMIEGEGLEDV